MSNWVLKAFIGRSSETIWCNGKIVTPNSCTEKILCEECDGRFSQDEKHFILLLERMMKNKEIYKSMKGVVYGAVTGMMYRKVIGNMDHNQLIKAATYFNPENMHRMIQQLDVCTPKKGGAPLLISYTQDSQAECIPVWPPVFICRYDEPMMYMKIGSVHFALLFNDKHLKQLRYEFADIIPDIEKGLLCQSKSLLKRWYKKKIQNNTRRYYKEKLKGKLMINMYEDKKFTHIYLSDTSRSKRPILGKKFFY